MCGIAGILYGPSAPAPLERELRRLADGLGHRGPDASGVFGAGRVGLAHTRLAILDLSEAGAQPMRSPDGRFVLVFNGEVYNFPALREELEAAGERFAGHSDTEVVLRLLARDGEQALPRLDGMFALALLDVRSGELLLARDRIGQKPLYLAALRGGGFAFASELAPLLRVPGVDVELDRTALSHLLSMGFVPAPLTLRRGVGQLLPGHCVRLRAGASAEPKAFVPPPGPREPRFEGSLDALSGQLEAVLSEAVRSHLVSDVPIGVLLSGGVDSSTVAALAARHVGRVKTFAVVHRDPAYDEREAARAVAQAIGSDHHELEFSDAPLSEEELDTLVDHHGDPFADSSSLAVMRISREMRRHVTVALSGDGGDEIFAGYPRYEQLGLVTRMAALPDPLLSVGSRSLAALPGRRARQGARVLRVARMQARRRVIAWISFFWPEEQARLLRPEWAIGGDPHPLDSLLEARSAAAEPDAIAAAHWIDQRLELPDDMLTKVDRMSMSTSLEVRPPLLANAVLDFAARLPFQTKLSRGEGKRVLRAVARRLVPAWVVDRPKKGFALPLESHGGRVFDDASRFALESAESPLRRIFRPEALGQLSRELAQSGEGRDPEDSPFRRVHRRWLLALLARVLVRQGVG